MRFMHRTEFAYRAEIGTEMCLDKTSATHSHFPYIHDKNFNFLFIIYIYIYTILSVTDFLYYMRSYTFTHYIILMMTLHFVPCCQIWNHRSRSRESDFSKSDNFITIIYPHFVFLPTNKKGIGTWKSEGGSRKSMEKAKDIQFHLWNTIFPSCEIQLFIFSQLWNITFSNIHYISSIFPEFHYLV